MEDTSPGSFRDKKRNAAEEKKSLEEEENNSDLEVLDVVRAKPRKPREVTVVELSSSEDEAASELPLHHQLDARVWRLRRDEQSHVGDHPGPAAKVELAAGDAAVG